MTCQEHTRALLDISMAMLAIQREMIALRQHVEAMRRPDRWAKVSRIVELIGKFLSTPFGQSLIGAAIASVAGFVRWAIGHG